MEYQLDYAPVAAAAPADARVAFIRRTYAHLFGAILAFVGIEAAIFNIPGIQDILASFFSVRYAGLILFAGFIGVSYLATYWATSGASPAMQYAGLGLYVVAEAVIFVPLLFIASNMVGGGWSLVGSAGVITILIFAGLTAGVFLTGSDFSYLGPVLGVCSMAAFGFIVLSIFLPGLMGTGTIFAYAMVALASGYIIYHTSNVLHQFRTDQHVAAALSLFASVALLFWYILQIMMSRRD